MLLLLHWLLAIGKLQKKEMTANEMLLTDTIETEILSDNLSNSFRTTRPRAKRVGWPERIGIDRLRADELSAEPWTEQEGRNSHGRAYARSKGGWEGRGSVGRLQGRCKEMDGYLQEAGR
jgi:hypothetical protein